MSGASGSIACMPLLAVLPGDAWPWIAGAATVIVLLSGAMLVFAKYLRISLRLFLETKMPMTADLNNGCLIDGEVHQFPSRDGANLMGVFIDPPPGVPVRGTVVFAHEFNAQRNSAASYTAGLPEMGFRVFTFDFRGHGESSNDDAYHPSHWATDLEVNDTLAAVAYVEATSEPNHPVAIMGVSRGACAAVLASIQAPNISALVLDGVFSTDLMVEGLMHRWAVIFASLHFVRASHPPVVFAFLRAMTVLYAELTMRVRYPSVRKALTRLRDLPALFVWGSADSYITPEHRVELYRIKPGAKQMWEAPRAKHNQAVVVHPERYREEITSFLEKSMPGGTAGAGGASSGR